MHAFIALPIRRAAAFLLKGSRNRCNTKKQNPGTKEARKTRSSPFRLTGPGWTQQYCRRQMHTTAMIKKTRQVCSIHRSSVSACPHLRKRFRRCVERQRRKLGEPGVVTHTTVTPTVHRPLLRTRKRGLRNFQRVEQRSRVCTRDSLQHLLKKSCDHKLVQRSMLHCGIRCRRSSNRNTREGQHSLATLGGKRRW